MRKILVPVDGSEHADRAVARAIELYKAGEAEEIHLLNVQIPIDSGHARMFVSPDAVKDYHREEGQAALAKPRSLLEAAGVPYSHHIAVGHVAETIVRYAQEHGFDTIVMGSQGRGQLLDAVLGSAAREVVRRSPVPVVLVGPQPAS